MAEQKERWDLGNEEFDLGTQNKISDEEITVFRDIAFKIRHPDGKREVPWPSNCNPKKEVFGGDKELAYQYIYEWETDTQKMIAYEVEVAKFIGLQYKIDFSGTKDCDIQTAFNKNGDILTIDLQPYERETVFLITSIKDEDNKYKINGSWQQCKIDPQLYRECITIANNKITGEYNKCMEAGLNEEVPWEKMPGIIRNNGILFVDGEFYPSNDALYYKGDNDANAVGDKNNDNFVMWRRAGDFLGNGPEDLIPMMFKASDNPIQPKYVRMGILDNAWLMAVVATLALKPKLIRDLFLSKDGSSDPSQNNEDKMYGFYRMRICQNGIWKEVILDDIFPCAPYYLPIYSDDSRNTQLWPHLIEKLVAKVRGNCYESLNGGSPKDAFTDLTGLPTETYPTADSDVASLFERVRRSYQGNKDLLAVAVTKRVGDDVPDENFFDNSGFRDGHVYSVLGTNGNGSEVILRDPLARDLDGRQYQGDGVTSVDMDDFNRYFREMIVCYSENNFKEARQTIDISYDRDKREVSVPVLKLTVPQGGNVEYLGLSQKEIITQSANNKNNNPSQLDLCLFVFKASQNRQTLNPEQDEPMGYIPMSTQRNKFVKFGASAEETKSNDLERGLSWKNGDRLTGGTYFMVPWTSGVQWETEQKQSYGGGGGDVRYIGFTVHGKCGSGNFNIQPVDGYTGQEINPVLLRFADKYGQKGKLQDLQKIMLKDGNFGQLCIIAGRNTCDDKNLKVSLTINNPQNIATPVGLPYNVGSKMEYKIEVGQSQLLAVYGPKDPKRDFPCALKWGLQNEWL